MNYPAVSSGVSKPKTAKSCAASRGEYTRRENLKPPEGLFDLLGELGKWRQSYEPVPDFIGRYQSQSISTIFSTCLKSGSPVIMTAFSRIAVATAKQSA